MSGRRKGIGPDVAREAGRGLPRGVASEARWVPRSRRLHSWTERSAGRDLGDRSFADSWGCGDAVEGVRSPPGTAAGRARDPGSSLSDAEGPRSPRLSSPPPEGFGRRPEDPRKALRRPAVFTAPVLPGLGGGLTR